MRLKELVNRSKARSVASSRQYRSKARSVGSSRQYRSLLVTALTGLLLAACEPATNGSRLGEAFVRAGRPEVWKLLPRGQAERVGLKPGDVLMTYNHLPVETNDDVRKAQAEALAADSVVDITVLRDDHELSFKVRPGPLGAMPVSGRYPSSLALTLEDILRHFGRFADYDWLAAVTGESFTFTANDSECAAWWPGGLAGDYLEDACRAAGLAARQVFDAADSTDPMPIVKGELSRGRVVLVQGGWPEHRYSFWGIATRYDSAGVYGYTLDASAELPLSGTVYEAYVVRPSGSGWVEPEELLRQSVQQALELDQERVSGGWKSGLDAYDEIIVLLDTVPFCPTCDSTESRACFDRLVWAMVAHKESNVRFLEAMRLALPDQTGVLDDIISAERTIAGKLEGMVRSGVRVGKREDQHKLARVFADIQLIESDLVVQYEALLAAL